MLPVEQEQLHSPLNGVARPPTAKQATGDQPRAARRACGGYVLGSSLSTLRSTELLLKRKSTPAAAVPLKTRCVRARAAQKWGVHPFCPLTSPLLLQRRPAPEVSTLGGAQQIAATDMTTSCPGEQVN